MTDTMSHVAFRARNGSMPSGRLRLAGALLLALLAAGCSEARISQFNAFADAGIKYADLTPAVYDQAFENAVKTDTIVLTESRAKLSRDARLDAIEGSNANLATRFDLLAALKAHSANLRSYFIALKALAASDADSGITQATKSIAGSLAKLSDKIKNAQFGGVSIDSLLGQAVPVIVAKFKSAALEREMKERAPAIERELALQQAALSAISESMKADLETQFAAQDRDRIVLPYVRQGDLPADWNDRRLAAFKRRLEIAAVDSAATAATDLHLSFVALAENRLDDGTLALLIGDLDKLVTLVEGIKSKPAGTK
jgi:hypothetical protein